MKLKLVNKLQIFLVSVAMVPLVVAGLGYSQASGAVEDAILERLEVLALERVMRIERLIEERIADVTMIAHVPAVSDALQDFIQAFLRSGIDSPAFLQAEERHRSTIEAFTGEVGIHDILLISPDGDVVFSLRREGDLGTNLFTGPQRDTELARVVDLVLGGQDTAVSELRWYAPSSDAAVFLAGSIKSGESLLGVLVVQKPPTHLNELAQDYGGLMNTGETVIVSVQGDETVFVTPTRHDPEAAFNRRVTPGVLAAFPAQEAAAGRSGRGTYPDYRGESVLAAWRYMPALDLGLVIKIDEPEALAPIRTLTKWFMFLGFATLLAVFAASLVFSRTMTIPIVALTQATSKMAAGDLTARADVRTADEIGDLATSFNDMAAGLGEARRGAEEMDWLKTGLAQLEESMRGDPDLATLASNVISEMAAYLDVQVGALYLAGDGDGTELSLLGSYAYTKRKNLSNRFTMGEGLVGQAALEKRQILVSNVPEDYVKVISGLGEHTPRFICVTPFLYEDRIKGVLEIGTLNEMTDQKMEYVTQAMPAVAMAVQSAESRVSLAETLDVSQKSSQRLQEQQEELRATNEELEEQAQVLKESEGRLQAQQEEMTVQNEELEEKNDLLERQKREVVQARKEIAEKAEDLALASKYKSEFLANMSHELRTPLNSMLLLSRRFSDNVDGNLSDQQVESAGVIHSSGNDLLSLINEILDLAKIEAGRVDIHVEEVLVSELADACRSSFQDLAAEKGLDLTVAIDDDAPGRITSDRKRVEQIIRNLVANAVKFTKEGGVTVTFGAPAPSAELGDSGLSRDQALAVAVRDTGIGIPSEEHRVIFEAFQQSDGGTTRSYGGTGLGLSISRELVRRLGGEIQLVSAPGEGSTFTVYLPIEAPVQTEAPGAVTGASAETAVPGGPSTAAAPKREEAVVPDDREAIDAGDRVMLVIEDDAHFAGVLVDQCRSKGLKCLAAASAEAGIDLARQFLPGGIILDLKLPDQDGWRVLEILKDDRATRHIPVHIISVEEPSTEGLRKGAIGHLRKPVTWEDIDGVLEMIEDAGSERVRNVLVVEDDADIRRATVELIADEQVEVDEASGAGEALPMIRERRYDCMILDLGLVDGDGRQLLEQIDAEDGIEVPPVIVYTARDLTREEEAKLRDYSDSIIIKGVRSEERLIDEVSLFLHRVVADMPERKRQVITSLHDSDAALRDRTVLIVDDDMRNVFALSGILSDHGMTTLKAENGEKALEQLDQHPDVDLVLMDIMMPVLDGLETTRRIRAQDRFRQLPIIALTAKAMEGDAEKCMEAGASDYASKPVDQDRLLSMMRVWLHQ